jgi:hypothetical protein
MSNRDPSELAVQFSDPLLAPSVFDPIQSAAYELVNEGASYRMRQAVQEAGATSVIVT